MFEQSRYTALTKSLLSHFKNERWASEINWQSESKDWRDLLGHISAKVELFAIVYLLVLCPVKSCVCHLMQICQYFFLWRIWRVTSRFARHKRSSLSKKQFHKYRKFNLSKIWCNSNITDTSPVVIWCIYLQYIMKMRKLGMSVSSFLIFSFCFKTTLLLVYTMYSKQVITKECPWKNS